ncbi:gluconate 5-dehydrogenase [Yersinia enterocolitica]|nr:gluconate 5-dehydrogenase [Yersinia enterocolitica]PNM16485.1 gluconate 5-dehydrogenase [Yersinia enterocolitica]PNM17737.1 gluconate 5-dehydrogenase [Yersinia enterocolitica]
MASLRSACFHRYGHFVINLRAMSPSPLILLHHYYLFYYQR